MKQNGKPAWVNRIVGYGEEDPEQLLASEKNWRIHPLPQQKALAGVLSEIGIVQNIIVNKRSAEAWGRDQNVETLVDGHLRVSLALSAGQPTIPITYVDLTPAEEAEVLATIDPLSAMAATDKAKLDELLREVSSSDAAVQAMLAELAKKNGLDYGASAAKDPGPQIDRAEELRLKWQTEIGQLWLIPSKSVPGKAHRLLCGDSTKAEDVARLMGGEKAALLLSDPPYGIGIVKSNTAGNFPGTMAPRLKATPLVGDDAPFDPQHLLGMATKLILWGANHYADKLPAKGKWLVWDKKEGAFEDSDLGDCELAWTSLRGACRLMHHTWQGMYRKGEGERLARLHPTQKPVALMAWCVEQAAIDRGTITLDCYLGSGTTMIAAEQTGRLCYGMEIESKYVAATLERLCGIGLKPMLADA